MTVIHNLTANFDLNNDPNNQFCSNEMNRIPVMGRINWLILQFSIQILIQKVIFDLMTNAHPLTLVNPYQSSSIASASGWSSGSSVGNSSSSSCTSTLVSPRCNQIGYGVIHKWRHANFEILFTTLVTSFMKSLLIKQKWLTLF